MRNGDLLRFNENRGRIDAFRWIRETNTEASPSGWYIKPRVGQVVAAKLQDEFEPFFKLNFEYHTKDIAGDPEGI